MRAVSGRAGTAALLVWAAVSLCAQSAPAATGADQQLADAYAPIVALKQQAQACDGDGEPYRPLPVDVVLGRPDVRLVDAAGTPIAEAPTAADLHGRGDDTYLDLPGDPLAPGCSYEQWAKQIGKGVATTAYAHIVTEPGKPGRLALQYWFYYPFNEFNNNHESDWEMIQLLFDASTSTEALDIAPSEVGYSQHSGGERASWDDAKLQRHGRHPIVYPGRGSHADYFKQAVWLGHGAQEGFGCDDTRSPSRLVQTHVALLPATATGSFAWLDYEGHWGEQERGPNNGPTGPNLKTQWTQPVTWAEDTWRPSSAEVPLQKTLGTSATGFFCSAVAYGSTVYLTWLRTPWFVLGVFTALGALGVWLSRRTRWSPVLSVPVDRLRSGGQIYRAGWRLYRSHWRLMLGIGLVFVPLSALAALAQALLFRLTGLGSLVDVVESDHVAGGVIALALGEVATIVASVLAAAAVAVALGRIAEGDPPSGLAAYRGTAPHLRALAWLWLRIIVVAALLAITIVGIPVAIVYLVRKAVVTQACVLEGLGAAASLRRSSELVRRHGVRVLAIAALVNVTAFLLGPIIGVLFLFLTSSSLAVIDLISSLVYVAVVPYAAVSITLLFYDLRRRLVEEPAPDAVLVPST